MQPEDLRNVLQRHVDDVVRVLLHRLVVWQRVALVELEARVQEGVGEPHVGEGAEEALVEVVGHAAAILDLVERNYFAG